MGAATARGPNTRPWWALLQPHLQYVKGTGRVAILRNQGVSTIAFGEVDLGQSDGAYYQLANRKTGQVISTGNKTNDANIGNGDVPDVVLEDAGAPANKDTQYWQVVTKPGGAVNLLNKSGGRSAGIWTANATPGQRIAQWVDDTAGGIYNVVKTADGYTRFQAAKNAAVYLTGASAGAPVTLQNAAADGSQDWKLVLRLPPVPEPTQSPKPGTTPTVTPTSVPASPPASASASPTAVAGGGNGTGGGLALTGSPIAMVAGIGTTVLVLGVALTLVAWRHRIRFDRTD